MVGISVSDMTANDVWQAKPNTIEETGAYVDALVADLQANPLSISQITERLVEVWGATAKSDPAGTVQAVALLTAAAIHKLA